MSERLNRQSFLGANSDVVLTNLKVALVGLGGAGSHVAQQLAHVGVGNFLLLDYDRIEDSNLNRLVGGTAADVRKSTWKTAIAARTINAVNPFAKVIQIREEWQMHAAELRDYDAIVGCIDTFSGRAQLEGAARRYLQPYLDVGMDVFAINGRYAIAGQVMLSMPGNPCLQCAGVIRNADQAREAAKYGAAGGRPQVVWPNGILASLVVGLLLQLVTPWHDEHRTSVLLEYDGNSNEIVHSSLLPHLKGCPHFAPANTLGDPWYRLAV